MYVFVIFIRVSIETIMFGNEYEKKGSVSGRNSAVFGQKSESAS